MFQRMVLTLASIAIFSLSALSALPAEQKLHPALRQFAAGDCSLLRKTETVGVRGNGRIPVIIYTQDAEQVRATGIHINSVYGGFVTAMLAPSDVVKVAAVDAVTYVRPSNRAFTDNDLSKVETGAQALHDGFINNTPYKGKGAIVMVYDSGIDWKHLDFRDPLDTTKSRILAIWDQTRTPSGSESNPSGFDYGVEYTQAQIEAEFTATPPGFVQEADSNGHGTHVAGTAAGNGSVIPRFAGTAPEADLIIVKGGNYSFYDAPMIDGLTYAATKAAELGKPIVVNWSLGSMWGPHDASTPTAKAIDAFCATAGHFHVNAAGNSGLSTVPIHVSGSISKGDSASVTLNVPGYARNAGAGNNAVGLFLMLESADSCLLRVTSPNNRTFVLASGSETFADSTDGTVTLENMASSDNGLRQMTFWVEDSDTLLPPASGTWTFTMSAASGSVTYNGWMTPAAIGSTNNTITIDGANNQMTVNESCSNLGLMVGSYFTRYSWPYYSSSSGEHAYYTYNYYFGDQIGQVSPFSSRGPSRDGRTKPDVVAPGQYVISTISSRGSYSASNIQPSRKYYAMSGTSMAAPNATGCAAILLAKYPTLTATEIKSVLMSTARADSVVGTVPNNTYGEGKLNVFKAMASMVSSQAETDESTYRYDLAGMSFYNSYMNYWVSATPSISYALRFTPTASGTVASITAGLRYTTYTAGAKTSLNCDVYSNTSGSLQGIPGTKLGGTARVLDSLDYWTTVCFDLLPESITVAAGTDYHVVLSLTNASSSDSVQIITDDGTANSDNRTSMLSGSTWTNSSSWSANANRNIRVRPVILSTSQPLAVSGSSEDVPGTWALGQNYPNPFNPTTVITYQVPVLSTVKLAVYDVLGREVAVLVNEKTAAGTHQVKFDGRRFASGVYFYRMQAGSFNQTRKLCLLK